MTYACAALGGSATPSTANLRTKCTGLDVRTKCAGLDLRTKCTGLDVRTKCTGLDIRTECTGLDIRSVVWRLAQTRTVVWRLAQTRTAWVRDAPRAPLSGGPARVVEATQAGHGASRPVDQASVFDCFSCPYLFVVLGRSGLSFQLLLVSVSFRGPGSIRPQGRRGHAAEGALTCWRCGIPYLSSRTRSPCRGRTVRAVTRAQGFTGGGVVGGVALSEPRHEGDGGLVSRVGQVEAR